MSVPMLGRIGSLLLCFLLLLLASPAAAGSKLDLVVVDLSIPRDSAHGLETRVRQALRKAAKQADFGSSKRVEVSIRVTKYEVTVEDDFLRVTCTMVGQLGTGRKAKSHLSFGGKPSKRTQLERQVLGAVTDGLVNRLAQLTKTAEPARRTEPKQK